MPERERVPHSRHGENDIQRAPTGVVKIEAAERLLGDDSPLVRGAAVWALSQLIARERLEALASKAMAAETDETVREEWRQAHAAARPST